MLEEAAVKVGTSIVTEVFKSILPGAKDYLWNRHKDADIFGKSAERYCTKTLEKHNAMKILGMREAVPLKDLYIRVRILADKHHIRRQDLAVLQKQISKNITVENQKTNIAPEVVQQFRSLMDLDSNARLKEYVDSPESISPLMPAVETREALDTVKQEKNIVVLGKPGSGKTTFLKYIALKYLSDPPDPSDTKIPVIITLKEYSESEKSLLEFITKQLEIGDLTDSEEFTRKLLQDGKCFILFDGLDEVAEEGINETIDTVTDFTNQYDKNKFIVSCRVAAYSNWFAHFKDIELANFDKSQIRSFIDRWFTAEPSVATACWEKVAENRRLMELASTPLLLTLICIAFNETFDLPYTRAELYELATMALLKHWDASRRIQRDLRIHLSHKRMESLYSSIAMSTFEKGQYLITEKTLIDNIETFFQNRANPNTDELEIDLLDLIKRLESHHGLIIRRSFRVYSFSHLSIQEYFAARYIKENTDSGTLRFLIDRYLYEVRWREVFIITADLLYDAGNFVLLMVEAINKKVAKSPTLRRMIREAINAASHFDDEVHTKGLAIACFLVYAVKNLPSALPDSVTEALYSEVTAVFYACHNSRPAHYTQKLRDILWDGSLLSETELDKALILDLDDLLYAFQLLLLCLNSDMTESKRLKINADLFAAEI